MLWHKVQGAGGAGAEGWNISTASYLQNFSVSAQDTSPIGVFFKPDGAKMYVTGDAGDDVNEYDLSTAWDISTASYTQNFSISTQGLSPRELFFKPDGTKMYVVERSSATVNEYNLSAAWDISTASYLQNLSVGAQEAGVLGLFIRSDGAKMYITGTSGDEVNEYNLSTAWNISTASHVQNFSVSAQDAAPTGLFFKTDGTKMYVAGVVGQDINEYSLSSSWDISTSSYVQNFSVSTQDTAPYGLVFKPDGTKMYIVGGAGGDINEYDVSS